MLYKIIFSIIYTTFQNIDVDKSYNIKKVKLIESLKPESFKQSPTFFRLR